MVVFVVALEFTVYNDLQINFK